MNKLKRVLQGITQRSSLKFYLPQLNNSTTTLRLMDLYLIKHLETPMTDHELFEAYNRVKNRRKATLSTIRRRRLALVHSGHVVSSQDYKLGKGSRVRSLWVSKKK